MNITELCYLDRVSYNGKTIVVCGINGTFNEVTDENNNIYDASVLSPIEVTDDMLLLNGFKKTKRWFERKGVYYEDGHVTFSLNYSVGGDWEECINAVYAHQLQHAIGRYDSDFARNFRTK